jgi:hypothetical protein
LLIAPEILSSTQSADRPNNPGRAYRRLGVVVLFTEGRRPRLDLKHIKGIGSATSVSRYTSFSGMTAEATISGVNDQCAGDLHATWDELEDMLIEFKAHYYAEEFPS